jgi:hypothetical protein
MISAALILPATAGAATKGSHRGSHASLFAKAGGKHSKKAKKHKKGKRNKKQQKKQNKRSKKSGKRQLEAESTQTKS